MKYKLIKVCGMCDADNIRAVERLGISWMGFIFAPKSSRYVAERPSYLPVNCKRVGVFVDAKTDEVADRASQFQLDIIQLHGHESVSYINALRDTLPATTRIIKVFNVATADDLLPVADYEAVADYFLFDTKAQLAGGNGTKFDWEVLTAYNGQVPFLLSGGIGPDDAARLQAFHHPKCVGIDLNSRFETAPAFKDISKLKTFLEQL